MTLLRLAGRLPDLGPETTEEEEAVRILRALPFHLRQVAVWMLRGIHAECLRGDGPGILRKGDRVRVVLAQEGTVVGEAEEPEHYMVNIDASRAAFHVDELIGSGGAAARS